MLETSIYVHLNPVRAMMVEKPEEYKWSSYSMFIGKSPKMQLGLFHIDRFRAVFCFE